VPERRPSRGRDDAVGEEGKIVRQVEVVARDPPADREEDICPGVANGEGK
jgi:hypothetical protein